MPSAVRILFVTESFGVGGTETHLIQLIPSLKSRGFDPAAFCFTERGSRAVELDVAGIPVAVAPRLGTAASLRLVAGAATLFQLFSRWRPSIAHFYLPRPYLVGAPVAIAAGVPINIMSRRSLSDYQRNWPGAARLESLLHRRMDAVTGNSRAVVKELLQEGCSESQVRLIYNGISVSTGVMGRAKARAKLGLFDQTFVATMVANLFSYKGHLQLLAAIAKIADKLPQPWKLLFVGRDAGEGPFISRVISDNRWDGKVGLLGERFDVPLILAASDIGILTPTRNEGLSNALLESMAAGLPVVVTDVGGNAEVVVDGETGFVVPLHDSDVLASAILRLAYDAKLRHSMGENAKRRVTEHFSFAASLNQYCSLYEELLGKRPF
jgi:glycosyltransferase involved in cell wall biosynthesis